MDFIEACQILFWFIAAIAITWAATLVSCFIRSRVNKEGKVFTIINGMIYLFVTIMTIATLATIGLVVGYMVYYYKTYL